MTKIETPVPQFDAPQLREALSALAGSPAFLHTAAGAALIRQLELHLSPGMLATARMMGIDRSWVSAGEVLHTVIVELCAQNGEVARRIAEDARDPWGYLAVCATRWVRALWGTRGIPIDTLELASPGDPPEDGSLLTAIQDLVRLAHTHLAPHLEPRLRRHLPPLLHWLAVNPPQRLSHELADREAAAAHFPDFTVEQIAAVANIAWGSRPRRRETSLMAALLRDADFHPFASPSHARALLQFRRAMRARAPLAKYAVRLSTEGLLSKEAA